MGKVNINILGVLKIVLPVLALSACAGLHDSSDPCPYEYPVRLHASSLNDDTKISVDGTAVAWESDDRIQINAVASDKSVGTSELTWFSGIDGKDSHHASFSGFVTMTAQPEDCYFVYPVKASTSVDPETGKITLYYNGQTGLHEPFMYAAAPYDENGISVRLGHVGAMLEITVGMDEVSQISFVGNRLETLSPVIVDPVSGSVSFADQSNVQITVPVNKSGKTYIAVPPVNLEYGFSLICSNADASKSMIRTFSSDGELGSGYDFSAKVGHIIPVTLNGELESFSVTCTEASVAHTKTETGLLNGTSVQFSMTKSGASDKIIEEWGATLLNKDGVVVRQVKYTNENPIDSQMDSMEVTNNWKLLPAGTYTFSPYYMIYGQKVTLFSHPVTVPDPGVRLDLHGQTSYDKYAAGDISGANSHTNTKIEGVAVSTNVDLSIIDSYLVTIDGTDLGAATVTSGTSVVASYGDLTRTAYKSYSFAARMTVGNLTFTADEKIFHITGLPYEADFTGSNPTGWTPAWAFVGNVEYSDKRVTYTYGAWAGAADGAIRSPAFFIPESNIVVRTRFDACSRNVNFSSIDNESYRDIYYVESSADNRTVTKGTGSVRAHYLIDYKSNGYLGYSNNMTLVPAKPAIMYATTSKVYNKAMYKIQIEYSE